MKVAVAALVPGKQAAPEFYRGILPATAAGVDLISTRFAIKGKDIYSDNADGERIPIDHDVVHFCRPGAQGQKDVVNMLQARGQAVTIDIDDDYQGIQPNHSAWRFFQPHLSPEFNWQISKDICKVADLVTCTTPAIMNRYAKHGRGKIIPNYVDESWLEIDHSSYKEDIIWTGFVGNHPDDLDVVGIGVSRFQQETGWGFFHLGRGDIPFPVENLEFMPWCPIEDYPTVFAQHGIAIAPLADSTFNRSKSWLKVLEASALGLPVVMSPSEDYKRIHELGLGILANKPRKWYTGLKQAYDNYDELSYNARQIAGELTIQKHIDEWIEAWQTAIQNSQ